MIPIYDLHLADDGPGESGGHDDNTGSLRQAIVPSHMLGRVISVAMVIAWSANPLGALLGGWVIERTGSVATVYAVIGVLTFLIPLAFSFTPLGGAERYLPTKPQTVNPETTDHAVAGA